ncbi:hypothetical protein INS49_010213 [Diaporthe citri]|uniref:uncharacterized protein n=1 Tax=Diaporthe citri TaxID=83186 RepID=UPI001C7FAC9F|nr:uncharacterized protein INS49_010213 [Diaporthe citri]KAG6361984.1 hypothetical protein INS49_010213 [Diaporthe citri]
MEAVGLAISIISLAGIFKDCIDLFSMISTAKSMEKDFTILSVKLDIEKTLLLQWAEHVRLVHEDYDRRLDNPLRGLKEIVPLKHSASVELLEEDVKHVKRISRLELLMDSAKDHDQPDAFTDVIQEQIDRRRQQRILDSLWYRMLDHRVNSVSEAHLGTFDWALHPPTEETEWENLSQWSKFGSVIYWIHGKPGSGKTTLMKYLYDNSKTQYGLYRGLLYYILKDSPSLIPDLLPEMWREAHNDGGPTDRTSLDTRASNLEPPTEEEMMLAFPRLKAHTQAAFCFFIDGLDEYSGDPFRLITFLEKLLEKLVSDNIKVVVSSRPIPSCYQAFSRGPKLRLQDLTRNDIKTYVHDTIALHPHTETIIGMDSTIVDKIQGELTEKASGVFLWVILACRSLIQGFAA